MFQLLLDVGEEAFEDAAVPAVLSHKQDRHPTGRGGDEGSGEKRRRRPDLEQEVAADERDPERDPAQHVLHALRAAVGRRRQHVWIEPSIRRLVQVVGEVERQHEQRRRPQVRHEGDQQQAERHRAERDQHERPPAAERRVEGVAPRSDDRRQGQGEEPFCPDYEADQRARGREGVQQRGQRHRDCRDREGKPEGAEAECPEQPPLNRLQRGQLVRSSLGRHQAGAAALS
jgi:hypothetical protein